MKYLWTCWTLAVGGSLRFLHPPSDASDNKNKMFPYERRAATVTWITLVAAVSKMVSTSVTGKIINVNDIHCCKRLFAPRPTGTSDPLERLAKLWYVNEGHTPHPNKNTNHLPRKKSCLAFVLYLCAYVKSEVTRIPKPPIQGIGSVFSPLLLEECLSAWFKFFLYLQRISWIRRTHAPSPNRNGHNNKLHWWVFNT